MRNKPKKPITNLENELLQAKTEHLVQDVIYNPHLSQCYILISFYPSTSRAIKDKILRYIKKTYDIIDAEYIYEDDSIYVTYDYWSRYVQES